MNETAQEISNEIVKAIYATLDQLGEDVALLVNDNVLSLLTSSMVYRELSLKPERKMTGKERQAFTENNYAAIKQRVQECVSAGFESATKAFSGIDTQYYCQVKRIPAGDRSKLC